MKLKFDFYARDTHIVAKGLLGKLLVRQWRNKVITGRITEVESYVGINDKACHASHGRTKRNEVMFGEAGHAYVYLIYGMYHCLNVVTERENFPAAVLIRALEPVTGIDVMQQTRKGEALVNLTNGPGKLTRALRIDKTLNGENLAVSDKLYVTDDGYKVSRDDIKAAARIGVDYAGKDALLPWRYYLSVDFPCFTTRNVLPDSFVPPSYGG
ncbi:MAG: DNA-3-methyladenine glycosylase [bacterium]|nr:DNA-3-methyladenine glycosylase [bacterium]